MTVRSTYSAHRRLVVGAIVLAVAAAGATTLATSAIFTDAQNVTAGAFTAGTVTLTAGPTPVFVAVPVMAPGDKVTAPITVTNTGSLAMRYSMTSLTTGTGATTLANQLLFTIKSGVATCDNAFVGGTVVYGPATLGAAVTAAKIFGDVAPGQTGTVGALGADRVLASGNEVLCFQVELPLASPNAFNIGQAVSTTFTFNAEQTKNN